MIAESSRADLDTDLMTLRTGQTVGRYRIVSVLGHGGFGITYRALDGELGREVALKEYLPAALAVRQDGTAVVPRSTSVADDYVWGRDRFVAEGRTLAALHRVPGVVLVHDYLEANGTAYLVMELVQGQTLQERVARDGPLDASAVERLLSPLLDGLERVHAAGFLHRDIKPANILLDQQGHPTLIDFGASRTAIAGRSQAMTAVFTPGYAAVEQFTATAQGPWTDIYGLGATLHFAITGAPPPNAVDRVLDDKYEPLVQSRRPFPAGVLAAIDVGLAVRAPDRPQSIAAWRPLFAQAASAVAAGTATIVMRGGTSAKPSVIRRPAVMVVAALAIVGMAAGAWYFVSQRSTTPAPAPAPVASAPVPAVPERRQEELEEARRAQQAAVEEVNRLRAEAEALRKRDEEGALRRKIEDEVRQKAAAEEAARRQAAEEAKRQADAEAAKASQADRATAEAAEIALHLTTPDRQRLQVALTALGFATGSTDGMFGPRTREMIAAWQKMKGRATTGYLSADAQRELLQDAAAAVARYDDEQRKAASAAAPNQAATSSPASGSSQCEGTFSSQWCRGAYQGFPSSCWNVPMTVRNGAISGQWVAPGASEVQSFSGLIAPDGTVSVTYNGIGAQTYVGRRFTVAMAGSVAGGVLTASGRPGENGRAFSVRVQCK
jgi:peptidoglycan hydrolase-like protein with peptidoglycan-binding domain